jgi:hypothetical protein
MGGRKKQGRPAQEPQIREKSQTSRKNRRSAVRDQSHGDLMAEKSKISPSGFGRLRQRTRWRRHGAIGLFPQRSACALSREFPPPSEAREPDLGSPSIRCPWDWSPLGAFFSTLKR